MMEARTGMGPGPGRARSVTGLLSVALLFLSTGIDAQEDPSFALAGHTVTVEGDSGPFRLSVEVSRPDDGVEVAHVRLISDVPATPPELSLTWSLPAHDVMGHWTTATRFNKSLGPDWGMSRITSMLAREAPVFSLFGSDDGNRLTFAVSDALNAVVLRAGIREEDARIYAGIDLYTERHRQVTDIEVEVRFDTRDVAYSQALGDVADWWASHDGYEPAAVPDVARSPMYSTWYSYHQSVDAESLLREVEISKDLGYDAIIIDDGWQTLDSQRGYAYTGDWEPERMPEMKQFVDDAHDRGMNVLLWYAMSLMGERAKAFPQFTGKYLRYWEGQGAYVLDPRYPEVRDFIIGTYRDAIQEWGVDGFKLDFLGFFVPTDSTVLELGDGRDYASVSRATDRLMTDVLGELRQVKPDVMIEFRQRYIGPLMRKYGNMFRAGDSPGAGVDNRVRTIDLRHLSGTTAVHSDMFMWHYGEPVEAAALQFLNILFSVPQLSVRLEDIPDDHRQMVTHYTEYWRQNRAVLLDGALEARSPMANYPLISARGETKQIIAVYADMVVSISSQESTDEIDVVNAKPSGRVVIDAEVVLGDYDFVTLDALGEVVGRGTVSLGDAPVSMDVPPSGLLTLVRRSR